MQCSGTWVAVDGTVMIRLGKDARLDTVHSFKYDKDETFHLFSFQERL